MSFSNSVPKLGSIMTDDAAPIPLLDEERAFVPYKPVDAQLHLSSGRSFRVSSNLIQGLKSK